MESFDLSRGLNRLRERFSEQEIQNQYQKAKVQKDEMLRDFWKKPNELTAREVQILAFCSQYELSLIDRNMIIRPLGQNARLALFLSN
jgi:hypothetical protein